MWTTKLSRSCHRFPAGRHEHAELSMATWPCGSHKMSKMHRVGSDRALHLDAFALHFDILALSAVQAFTWEAPRVRVAT